MQEPGCAHVGSSSVSGCQSTLIFEGIVLPNPLLPQQPAHTLSVRVNVFAVYIGGAFEGSVLPPAYKAPFTASVTGFQPCCMCSTEPPATGLELLFFITAR